MKQKLFFGQKITVMGLGLHGGGVAVVKWLVKHGAVVTVTDLKSREQLKISIAKLKGLKVRYVLGEHREKDFRHVDLVVQNPGVPRESKYIKIAKKAHIPIENEASLFLKYCSGQIIGVTGTRGKSTTASLIYSFLKTSYQAWLAGLSQKPMLEILDKVKDDDLVVLELSSWQLEILGEQKISPDIAVVTNIYPDHLNRYRSMSDYIAAKKNIFRWQNKDGISIFNAKNYETRKMAKESKSKVILFSTKEFIKTKNIFGQHNNANIQAALAVASVYKISSIKINQVLKNFKTLPGRLEFISQFGGVFYVNDTTATTPDATIAALNSLPRRRIILIAGGDTKNIPQKKYSELAKLIEKKCKAVVLFSGYGSAQIVKNLAVKNLVIEVNNMTEAVSIAKSFSVKGDYILLSPACASFNLFVNEFDRGDRFNKIVSNL